MPAPEQVRAAVDAYIDAYQRADRDVFLAAFADDGVVIDPVGTPPHVGRDARATFWDSVHQLAEKISFDVHDVIVAGDEAAMVFTIQSKVGDNTLLIDAVDVFTVGDDGRITQMKAYWDLGRARPQ